YPGIKIHDTRIIRLMEVLLHGGNTVGGCTAKHIHQTILQIVAELVQPVSIGRKLKRRHANSKATVCSNATVPATLTGSLPKACRSRSCSCSSTSNSAALSPTAGFITSQIPARGLIANSKLRTTRQTRPFSKSLICLSRRDV